MTFRCSAASLDDAEPMGGTAPTERAFFFVEYAGAWGRDAPALLADHVSVPTGVRPQLVRRHRSVTTHGIRVFAAWAGPAGFTVESATLGALTELDRLDLDSLAAGASPGLEPHAEPLWLVCTNGRRDVCCAELGRPVAAALTERWPDQTWETTHLGGHRFSATLLALPTGITLGRLEASTAVAACEAVAAGQHPVALSRGRAGREARAQVAELAHPGARTLAVEGDRVTLDLGGSTLVVTVDAQPGPPRRQSCADLKTKPGTVYRVR